MAFIGRVTFLAFVVCAVAALGGAVVLKSAVFVDKAAPSGGARSSAPPRVVAGTLERRPFFDSVQAIGSVRANESIEISTKVTDTIQRINFESGDRVAKDAVLVELASVEQTAELSEARATLEVQSREYERFAELGERGFAPTARVETARAAYEQAQARIEALESRIADRVIRAPFAGVIGLRRASPGALVRPGDVIGTLDDISQVKLDFAVAESQIADVKRGAPVVARSAAFPEREFEGNVADADTRLDPTSRTLTVRAVLPNPDGSLKPGMLLTVQLRANAREVLAVPESALLERAEGSYILVLDSDGPQPKVRQAPVTVGTRAGGFAEILGGVDAGMRVVIEGVQRARPGQTVTVEPATAPGVAGGPSTAPDRAR